MAVGILLVTHRGIGPALRQVAERLLGNLPLQLETFELDYDSALCAALPQASALLRKVDSGDGALYGVWSVMIFLQFLLQSAQRTRRIQAFKVSANQAPYKSRIGKQEL